MRSSESSGAQRKPAKYAVDGAVDFICLLSKDGDVFPEPPKAEAKGAVMAADAGAPAVLTGAPDAVTLETGNVSADLVFLENALDDDEVIGESCR
jgi:hypothetical protein